MTDPELIAKLELIVSNERTLNAELREEFKDGLKALEDKLQTEYFGLDKEHRERVDALKNQVLKLAAGALTLGAAGGGGAWWLGG